MPTTPLSTLKLPPPVTKKLRRGGINSTESLRAAVVNEARLRRSPMQLSPNQIKVIKEALSHTSASVAVATRQEDTPTPYDGGKGPAQVPAVPAPPAAAPPPAPVVAPVAPGGKSLAVVSVVAFALLTVLLAVSLGVLFLQNGYYTAQQLFAMCFLFAIVASVMIFALFSVASLRSVVGGKIVVSGVPLQFQLAGAAAAFVVFFVLIAKLAPNPSIRTVYLTVTADEHVSPSFELRYRRGKIGPNLVTWRFNEPVQLMDVPAGATSLEVDSILAPGLWTKEQSKGVAGPWIYAIDGDGYARIPLSLHNAWPEPLEKPEVQSWLDSLHFGKEKILARRADRLKKQVSLTIVNRTERPLWIEAFDCTRLFDTPDAPVKDGKGGRLFTLIREFNTREEPLEPNSLREWKPALDQFRDPSGWVAFYAVFQDPETGKLRRSRVAVRDVFTYRHSRLTIGSVAGGDQLFDATLTSDDSPE